MDARTVGQADRPVREVGGVAYPVPGTWRIDPGHAEVAFTGRHFMLTKIRGRFTGVTGEIRFAEGLADSQVEVVIDMASVDSGDPARDEHLRSADQFDVTRFPTATFRSTRVGWDGGTIGKVEGDLTIHGVTRTVVLDVDYRGYVRDPWGNDRAVFSAATRLNREDFGITWNMVLDTGGLLVSRDIDIAIELEAVREAGRHP